MKKLLNYGLLLFILSVIALTFAACSNNTGGNSTSSESSSGEDTYKIATDTSYAPFEFENNEGKRVGIDIDLLEAIAKNQNFKYELQALDFDEATQELEEDKIDGIISGVSITDELKQKFDFSEPYFESGVICAVAENSEITGYEGLRGKSVTVKTGTEGEAFANSIKDTYGFTVTTTDDPSYMYEDVKDGSSAACFEEYPVIGYYIKQGEPLKMIGGIQQGSSLGFVVKKGSEKGAKLLEMFNAGLNEVKGTGEYDNIVNTYIKR